MSQQRRCILWLQSIHYCLFQKTDAHIGRKACSKEATCNNHARYQNHRNYYFIQILLCFTRILVHGFEVCGSVSSVVWLYAMVAEFNTNLKIGNHLTQSCYLLFSLCPQAGSSQQWRCWSKSLNSTKTDIAPMNYVSMTEFLIHSNISKHTWCQMIYRVIWFISSIVFFISIYVVQSDTTNIYIPTLNPIYI